MVYIKEIRAGSEEHRIAEILRQEEWTNDPRNHCVPVLNIFKDPQDPVLLYLVMPFLRPAFDPPFEHVKEIMEFTDQILEVDASRILISKPPNSRAKLSGVDLFAREGNSSSVRITLSGFCRRTYIHMRSEIASTQTS